MQSALNRTFHAWNGVWWMHSDVRSLGQLALQLAYGADKYDVLNKLCCPYKQGIMSFVRCDIRHRSRFLDLLILLLLTLLLLMLQPIIYVVTEIVIA